MRANWMLAGATLTAIFMGGLMVLPAQSKTIDMAAVPANVREKALETAPGVEFYKVSIERENGVDIYEFEARDYRGRHVEVDVTEDGKLEEIEMELTEEELPSAVSSAISDQYNGFRYSYVEVSVRPDGRHIYEVEGFTGSGQKVDLEISEGGRILSTDRNFS